MRNWKLENLANEKEISVVLVEKAVHGCILAFRYRYISHISWIK